MDNTQVKKLCLALMLADKESDVVALLRDEGLWDDSRLWRYYGDNELNWSQAGGQQGRADFALNEKVINAIDAVLTKECLLAGVNPQSPEAPQSIRSAVARFIEKADGLNATTGRVEDWTNDFRRRVAENISVFATEPPNTKRGIKPSISVADLGEGHTPDAFPNTLVSLGKKNKASVQFVQGKFCQGGSGAIRHCGEHKLQLVVSRRHPKLLAAGHLLPAYPVSTSDDCWGFTIVRREAATATNKLPMLTYLAPISAIENPRCGGVLRFRSPEMPLFPMGHDAYMRNVEWGTLIKLYSYQLRSTGNIIRGDGLLYKLDLLLPDPALPVRMHECRPARRGAGAAEQTTTMSGLFSRLRGNENLEIAPPSEMPVTVRGKQLIVRVFAFKAGKGKTYRANEGVVFTVNGQAHAEIKDTIFIRKKVGYGRLQKDLLVVVDCSNLDANERDDLFMSSRDRVADESPLFLELESALEDELSQHPGLRELRNRRAQEELEDRLSDDKPLEQVLSKILRSSPALAKLFGRGERLPNPFKPKDVSPAPKPPKLVAHPTFFHFAGRPSDTPLARTAHVGQKCRINFTTDAEDTYFTRKYDKGRFLFRRLLNDESTDMQSFTGPSLVQGRATVSFDLPDDVTVGSTLAYELIVEDDITQRRFANRLELTIAAAQPKRPPTPPMPHPPPGKPPGSQKDGEGGIALPKVLRYRRADPKWGQHFNDDRDCMDVIEDPDEDDPDTMVYRFYLNEDNLALQTELKATKRHPKLVKKQFELGALLVALALIHEEKQSHHPATDQDDDSEVIPLRKKVGSTSRALAPVLLPMIQALGELTEDDAVVGDDENSIPVEDEPDEAA